jgi:LacI family transcriptional regulator
MAKVTTTDIALAAGVSQSTVSFVLNNVRSAAISPATRERILQKAEELGYHPRKRKKERRERTVTIGVLVPTLSNFYYPQLLQNIELYAYGKGVNCIIINALRNDQIDQYFNYVYQHYIDGLLCLYTPEMEIPDDIPAVLIGEKGVNQVIDTVSLNSINAGHIITDHLIDLGHTRFAFISTPLNKITPARQNRLEGIRKALALGGIEKNLTVLVDQNEVEAMDIAYEYTCGRSMTGELLKKYRDVSAIIAVNDMTAIGVISMLSEKGIRIPQDIAVAGFDNILLSTVIQPQLTTMEQMAFHGTKLGFDILLEKLNNKNHDGRTINIEYEPHLIVRESTMGGGGG